ncbi:hypothetical protein BGZ51_008114, partial [Haplosporangium sp. Z 767]
MVTNGVLPTLEKHGYRCTNQSDLKLVTGWMEIVIILFKIVRDASARQEIMDQIYQPYVGATSFLTIGLTVDKSAGIITLNGKEYKFTPVYDLT